MCAHLGGTSRGFSKNKNEFSSILKHNGALGLLTDTADASPQPGENGEVSFPYFFPFIFVLGARARELTAGLWGLCEESLGLPCARHSWFHPVPTSPGQLGELSPSEELAVSL